MNPEKLVEVIVGDSELWNSGYKFVLESQLQKKKELSYNSPGQLFLTIC